MFFHFGVQPDARVGAISTRRKKTTLVWRLCKEKFATTPVDETQKIIPERIGSA